MPTPTPIPTPTLAPSPSGSSFDPLSFVWAWLSTQAGAVSAAATLLTAIVAILALTATARDSRARSRPLVMAHFRLAENSDTSFDFVVRNYGQSAARNVIVQFDPPLDEERRQQITTKYLAERYDKPIPLLPPAVEITNVYWSGTSANAPMGKLVNNLKTPDKVTVTITYKAFWWFRYKEVTALDADWMGLQTTSESSSSMPGRMKTIADSLKTIATETTSSRRQLTEIADSLAKPDDEMEETNFAI